jgi:hypothetical protein
VTEFARQVSDRMASKTQQKLWETVPFGILHWIDQRIRTRIPLEAFQDQLEKAINAEQMAPVDAKVIEYLYERVVDARMELDWIPILHRIRKSSTWKSHRAGLDGTLVAARQLEECAEKIDERFLLPEVCRTVRRAAKICSGLSNTLAEIESWNTRMEAISRQNNRNIVLRSVRRAMYRTLKKYCPDWSQEDQAALIRVAVEVGKLKEEETTEAILRVLRRYPVEKTSKT